jgi:putative ABC transport system ATP-binding protein
MIEYKNVGLRFQGKVIFQDVNFQIKSSEKVIISGKSGTGKSSLLHLLLGFKIPNSGSILFENRKINAEVVKTIRKKVAYVPQGVFIGRGIVEDLIKEILSLKANRCIASKSEKLFELLEFVELSSEVLQKRIESLSGGEKQRIAIVIALLLQRNIFLLDEITSSLDIYLKKKMTDYFLTKKDATVLLISHDILDSVPETIKIYDLEKNEWKQ